MATTAVCNSFKVELMQGAHCFNATQSAVTVTNTSGAFTFTSITSTAGLSVGMAVSGTNVPASAVIASVDSATALTISKASTGAVSSATFIGDAFKLALVKVTPGRTFDGTQTNIGTPGSSSPTATNLGTDEVSGAGYTTGGIALVNSTPSLPGSPSTTATTTFSNVSWTTATISTTAAIIYNNTIRLGAAAAPLNGRTVEVLDLGGTQTVTAGTLTLTFPTNDGTNAVLRIA